MASSFFKVVVVLFFPLLAIAEGPTEWIDEEVAGVSINNLTVYSDSSFGGETVAFYKEGAFFKVVKSTRAYYEDDAQKQLFKWYKIETIDHRVGWVYGNDIAIIKKPYAVPNGLKTLYKKEKYFGNEFGTAKVWVASLQGKDILSDKKNLKPEYREDYLVFTNSDYKSAFILISNFNLYGSLELKGVFLKDLTGNGVREIILEKNSKTTGDLKENKALEVYSFIEQNLEKVFEESLNLEMQGRKSSPAGYKLASLQDLAIRIEYVDFNTCRKGSEKISWQMTSTQEYCPVFVTYTYYWNNKEKRFEILYPASEIKLSGRVIFNGSWLKDQPGNYGRSTFPLQYAEVIKIDGLVSHSADRKDDWYKVTTETGHFGYVPAKNIMLRETAHASIINAFYNGQETKNRKFVEIDNN
ncbi:MAG: hypothetical protein R2784_12915 [Saprospiraceae bacterium]